MAIGDAPIASVPIGGLLEQTLDVAASALVIGGALTPSGDIQIGTSFSLTADPISMSGVIVVTGSVSALAAEVFSAPPLVQRLESSTRMARTSASRGARLQSRNR